MSTIAVNDKAAPTAQGLSQHEQDRAWALRWSYVFLTIFAIFFLMPPVYMFITSLKSSAEIGAQTNPWVVYQPDARQLHRAADLVAIPDVLPQLGDGVGLHRDHHHADRDPVGVRAGAHAVLGLGRAGDRHLPDLPGAGHAAVPAAVQDVCGVPAMDRDPAAQSLVGAADRSIRP